MRFRLVPVSFVDQTFPLLSCGGFMKRFLKGLVGAAWCLLALSPALAQNASSTKVEAPSLKIGDSWTYDRTDGWKNLKEYTSVVVVTAVNEGEIRTEAKRTDNGEITTIIRNKDLNRRAIQVANRKFDSDPYYPTYAFPLEIGKSWEKEVTFTRNFDDRKVVTQLKGEVIGREKVTVPAGTFDALKIVVKGSYNGWSGSAPQGSNRWSGQQSETIWYAPEVKNAVKSIYEDSNTFRSVTKTILELVEYKLAQ